MSISGLLFAFLVAACGLSAEERLARGQQAYDDGEYRAAAIDARSVLQEEPQNVDGRLLLGRAALRIGDLDSAEKELRRAIELGTDQSTVAVELGRVLLAKQNYQQLLDEITLDSGASDADTIEIRRLQASAHLGLGNVAEARELYQEILAADDRDAAAMLGIVSTYQAEGRIQQARDTLDQALSIDDTYVPAWLKSAELNFGMRNAERAETDYARAAEMAAAQSSPDQQAAALRGLVETRLTRENVDGATEALEQLAAIAPDDIRTTFLRGRLAYARQDLPGARDHLQAVLRAAPEFRPAQMLLGAVHLNTGNLGQAEMHLAAVVAAVPDNDDARRLLAETRLRQNKADDASSLLQPLIEGDASDSRSLGMAARANLAAGNYSAATELLRRQIEQDPGNTSLQLDLAAAMLAAGDVAGAEAILADSGDGSAEDSYRREMLNIFSRVRSQDMDAAAAAAQAMIEKHPDDARLRNMLGGIHLATGDTPAAAGAFDAALGIDATDRTARVNLGRIEAERGNLAAARGHFSAILEHAPEDAGAMMALGMVAATEGNSELAIDWLERARAANDTSAAARLMLAQQYLAQNNPVEAEKAAAEAVALDPESALAHAALGAAQEGMDDHRRALQSYRRAAELEPDNMRLSLNYARAQLRAGDEDAATETLAGVEEQGPADLRSSVQLAALKAGAGDLPGAIKIGEDLRQRFPDSETPNLLLGELYFRNGEAMKGAEQFDRALEKTLNLRIAGRAYALRRANSVPSPERPIERFLEQNPDSEPALLALAQHHQGVGNEAAAMEGYDAVLEQNPTNFAALNNLAWLYVTNGDDRAESLARRAYDIAPDNGSVTDTLGWILIRNGSLEEGVELLRKADELSDGRPTIRYHLAVGLAETGAADEARAVLDEILASGDNFDERSEAEALRQRL